MEIRHLKLIKEVAETKSLTKAKDKLFLSQSALSHQLKEIEGQLGTPLFHRVNKQLILTGAGKMVLESAERVLTDLEKTEIETTVIKRYTEKFRFFALAAAVLLLLELLLRYTILRAIP